MLQPIESVLEATQKRCCNVAMLKRFGNTGERTLLHPPHPPEAPRYLKKMLQRIKGVFKNTYTRCCNVAMLQCLGNAGERALLHPPRNTSPKHTICESNNSPAPRGAPPFNSRHASMIIVTSRWLLVWEETDMFDKLLATTLVKMTHVPDTYHGQYLRFCGAQP